MSRIDLVPTKEQQEIYDYCPLDMIITAPVGCGKTEALAYRAKGLISRFNFDGNGRKLLIVTFTNQARDNINERLKKYVGTQALKRYVIVCNFHGLASRIINSHRSVIDFDENWRIANFDWSRRAINTLNCSQNVKQEVATALQAAKQQHISDIDVAEQLRHLPSPIKELAASIEALRIKEKIITYDDQIRIALWILRNNNVAKVYKNHFFAALVDEFQDLTPHQLTLVKTLCGENVTYAGDLAQSIFSFAGADSQLTYRLIARDNRKQIKLLKSFRSSPAVLSAVNSLSPITKSEPLTAAYPERWANGGLMSSASFANQNDEAEWIIKISQLILNRCPSQRIGIIARTAFRANGVKHYLESKNIEYADWGNGLFRPKVAAELRDVCNLLSDKTFERQLDLYLFIRERIKSAQHVPSDELEDASGWLFDQVSQFGLSKMQEIKARIHESRGGETIATRPGIHCLTGHAGKGQQFDWVFVIGLEQGTIPFYKANTDEETREEARILSVMISRARIGFIATSTSFNAHGYKNSPSVFSQYLTSVNGHLIGKSEIESWFAQADWAAIART